MATSRKIKYWEEEGYYNLARSGSLDKAHPGMVLILEESKRAKSIVDLGCGEGTRLGHFYQKGKRCIGVDLSQKAIKLARANYPKIEFINSDIHKLPFKSGCFDLVYSAYVLEHLDNPQKAVEEALRIIKKDGKVILVAPNYGAPNRCSPPFRGSRLKKLFTGFIKDFLNIFDKGSILHWAKVEPIITDGRFTPDVDTQVEPYIGSLVFFLKKRGIKIVYRNTCWERENKDATMFQKVVRFFAEMGIYPFINWGPHMVLMFTK